MGRTSRAKSTGLPARAACTLSTSKPTATGRQRVTAEVLSGGGRQVRWVVHEGRMEKILSSAAGCYQRMSEKSCADSCRTSKEKQAGGQGSTSPAGQKKAVEC